MKHERQRLSSGKRDFAFHAQKMRYQNNSLSYAIVILSIVFSLLGMFTLINFDSFESAAGSLRVIPDMRVGAEILIGIVTLLVTFLAAEKMKCYNPVWSYGIVYVIAAVDFWRMLSFPAYVGEKMGWVPPEIAQRGYIYFLIAGLLMVVAGLIASLKVYILRNFGKETVR